MISVVSATVPEKMLKQTVGNSESMDTLGIYAHEVSGEAQITARLITDTFAKLLN